MTFTAYAASPLLSRLILSIPVGEGSVHRAELPEANRERGVGAGQLRQARDSSGGLLAPVVVEGGGGDVEFARSCKPDRVDNRARAPVLKDVRGLKVAV